MCIILFGRWGRPWCAQRKIMNGHHLLLSTTSFEAHDPPHTMGLVNLFLFNKFRTCVRDRIALNSFRFMHLRTTPIATEGWGRSVLSASHQLALSCEGSRITSHPLSSLECAVPRFRALSALKCAVTKTRSRNSFRMRSYEKRWGGGSECSLIPNGPAGAAFVVTALQPPIAQQNRFHARNHNRLGLFNRIAGALEEGNRVRRNAALDAQRVRLQLMMNAREVYGVLHVHAKIHNVEHHLHDRSDDHGATRRAQGKKGLAILQHDGGNHRRKRAAARRNGIGLALHQPEKIDR